MNKKYLIFLSIFALISCHKEIPLKELKEGEKILAFGDSLTLGYGAALEKSYPTQLSKLINREVINSGKNGDTTSDGIKRFSVDVYNAQPKLIILSLGGNDMIKRLPPDETRENLKQMISIAQERKIQIILLSEPRPAMESSVIGLSDASFYEEIAEEMKIPVIQNVFSKWLSHDEYKFDLIHLNEEGYKKVSEDIASFLIKNKVIVKEKASQN